MGKPFFETKVWNDGEYNICSKCGKRFICKKGKACKFWSDESKNIPCECNDCNPSNVGSDCEEIIQTKTWSVS